MECVNSRLWPSLCEDVGMCVFVYVKSESLLLFSDYFLIQLQWKVRRKQNKNIKREKKNEKIKTETDKIFVTFYVTHFIMRLQTTDKNKTTIISFFFIAIFFFLPFFFCKERHLPTFCCEKAQKKYIMLPSLCEKNVQIKITIPKIFWKLTRNKTMNVFIHMYVWYVCIYVFICVCMPERTKTSQFYKRNEIATVTMLFLFSAASP